MREEASFHVFFVRVRASARKLEIDDSRVPRKRKVSCHYEEREAPVEFVCMVEGHYRQMLYLATNMVVNCIRHTFQYKDYFEIFTLREEDFGH